MRLARRDTFREAVFACRMPFWAARIISGSAARRAAAASAWLPAAIASSTLRTKVRMRLRRERLIAVRFAILRVIFLADTVLAIGLSSSVTRPTGEPAHKPGRDEQRIGHRDDVVHEGADDREGAIAEMRGQRAVGNRGRHRDPHHGAAS